MKQNRKTWTIPKKEDDTWILKSPHDLPPTIYSIQIRGTDLHGINSGGIKE